MLRRRLIQIEFGLVFMLVLGAKPILLVIELHFKFQLALG